MSDSDTCNCHFHWTLQENDENGWWPERLTSDDADQDKSPFVDVWSGGWLDGWNGRPGGRLDRLQNGWRDGGQVDGRVGGRLDRLQNGWRDGGQVDGRVSGWDGTPSSSFRRTLPRILVYLEKCCRWYNVPDGEDGYYTAAAHAIHHDHHGYIINGSSDSVMSFVGVPINCGQTGPRRVAPSSRRHRPRIVHGTELF
ncbi:unnamed protein product [Macrosiphum euphorbiae]|uniref:Uncharacterized protein n=1 Tax=Macrosiphum euphorbiae TaxID=13131 RepID=A0AAV0VHL2_9HEMI|nr:unnamed protein product [Macrosiphum euphorbiae]